MLYSSPQVSAHVAITRTYWQVVQLWKMSNCNFSCSLSCYATVCLSKRCNCGRWAIAVSTAGCYAMPLYISACGATVEDELSKWCNCGRWAIAVSVADCYAVLQYVSASGAIVEDEQLQCKQRFSIPISWECESTGVHGKLPSLLTSFSLLICLLRLSSSMSYVHLI